MILQEVACHCRSLFILIDSDPDLRKLSLDDLKMVLAASTETVQAKIVLGLQLKSNQILFEKLMK